MARRAKKKIMGPILWTKLQSGEDLIGEVIKLTATAITIRRPMSAVFLNDSILLMPFGLYSISRDFTFTRNHVIQTTEVIESVAKYYEVSIEYTSDNFSRYDNLIKRVTNKVEAAILDRDREALGPKEEELNKIEEEQAEQIKIHDPEAEVPPPVKRELIDRVVALAEAKGLGKKKNEADKEEE